MGAHALSGASLTSERTLVINCPAIVQQMYRVAPKKRRRCQVVCVDE
eukprot:COSAG01_NODE_254_length_20214_cov_25.086254_24_plen_47_part_00